MITTTAIDPAAAIAAAHQELYEQLRDLVAGGPADDLIDRVRKLTASVGRKITRARKAAAPAETPPAEPQPTAPPAPPRSADIERPPDRPAPSPATTPPAVARPARQTVPRRAYLLAVILLGVLGVALAVTISSTVAIGATVTAVLAVGGWRVHRRLQERAR